MIEHLKLDIWLLGFLFLFAIHHARAAVPTLENLSQENAETVVRDFSANFVHTSVSPASGLRGFGVEIGALAGLTQSPGINTIVQENYGYIPHAGAIGILYLPGGFRGEYLLLPKYPYQGASLENNSGAFAWTPTEIFSPTGFLAFRIRGFYGDGKINYSQTINEVPIEISFQSFTYGGDATLSFQNIPFIEPYLSAGVVKLDGQLRGSGSVSIFDSSYTVSKEVRIQQDVNMYAGGFVIKLPLLVAGAEYAKIADNTRITVKLALQFSASDAKNLGK